MHVSTSPSAPVDAKYITQTADGVLTAEQSLGALATGLLKNTTTSGILSIGAAGTDYQAPGLTVLKAGDTMTGQLTYGQPSAVDATFYRIDPDDADARLFNWNLATSSNLPDDARNNIVFNWGYNQGGGGGASDGTDSAFYQQIETHYPSGGGNARMEYHWDFFLAGGLDPGVRPMHLNLDKNTGLVDLYWYTDTFTWLSAHDGSFGLMAVNSGATALLSQVRVYIPSSFEQLLSFTGTTHAGIQLNSLTTAQRNALTAANGMIIYNSTDGQVQGYVAGVWGSIGGSSLPVADTTSIVMGSADNTKLFRIEVDGFTAGATRVMTPPNQNFLAAGQDFANVFTTIQTINPGNYSLPPIDAPSFILKVINQSGDAETVNMYVHNLTANGYTEIAAVNDGGTFSDIFAMGIGGTATDPPFTNSAYVYAADNIDSLLLAVYKPAAYYRFDIEYDVEVMRIEKASAVAGDTVLMLFDVDNNTVERVSVGAADSGGVGYKLLRIPN